MDAPCGVISFTKSVQGSLAKVPKSALFGVDRAGQPDVWQPTFSKNLRKAFSSSILLRLRPFVKCHYCGTGGTVAAQAALLRYRRHFAPQAALLRHGLSAGGQPNVGQISGKGKQIVVK